MAKLVEVVGNVEWKRARVSSKRQVTIPQKFYEQLGIKDEVEFGIKDNSLIIRPVREYADSDSYADFILADLIQQGLQGDALLAKFREKQAALRGAVQSIVAESREAARQYGTKRNDETKDLFGDVMED